MNEAIAEVEAKRIKIPGVDFGWIEAEQRFKTFDPKPKQLQFIQSQKKYEAFLGAFRSGKSLAASFKSFFLSLDYPGNVGLICRKDYTTLRDSTMQTFFGIIPKTCPLVLKWNESTHDLWLKTRDPNKPSHIMFRGAEEYKKFGSYELGWFWIDQAEEVPEMIFRQLSGRLSKPGVPFCGMLTPNPPGQYHWLHRRFKKEFNPNTDLVIHTSTYDNKENLPPGYIEDLERQPEQWKKAFLYGEWAFVAEGDPVYAIFKSDIHMAKEPLQFSREIPIIRSWDFGYRSPACGWYQISRDNDRIYKLAELIGINITIDQFADKVLAMSYERFGNEDFEDCGDPAGLQKNDKSEQCSIEILEAKGIENFKCQRTFVNDGINLVRRALLVRDDGIPSFIIDPSCQITEEAYLGGYFLREGEDEPHEPNHPYADVADTDRYLFVNYIHVDDLSTSPGWFVEAQYRPRKQWFDHLRKKEGI